MGSPRILIEVLDALTTFRTEAMTTISQMTLNVHSHGDHDALGLIFVAASHVAAVETLGKEEVEYVLPATAAARSGYEAVAMAAWLVEPASMAERDRRWFGLLLDERSFWEVMVREATHRGDPDDLIGNLRREIQRINNIVGHARPQLTKAGVPAAKHPPKMDRLLDAIGQRKHYVSHKYASQFTHPGTRSLRQVRDIREHAGTDGSISIAWRTKPGEWTVAILLAAESLMYALETVAAHFTPPTLVSKQAVNLYHRVVRLVPQLGPPTAADAVQG